MSDIPKLKYKSWASTNMFFRLGCLNVWKSRLLLEQKRQQGRQLTWGRLVIPGKVPILCSVLRLFLP